MEVSRIRYGGMSLPFSPAVILETFEFVQTSVGIQYRLLLYLSRAWNRSWQTNEHRHSFYRIVMRQPGTLRVPGQAG